MTTADEALAMARPWALASLPACAGQVDLWEFDLGYVVWPVPQRSPDRSGPPLTLGAPRAVIDRHSGELTVWPSLAAPAVADLYRQSRQAELRFPAEVRAVLTGSGWRPGRDVSSWVARWLESLYQEQPAARDRLPLFPRAGAALAEFGGLRLEQVRRAGYAGGGFRIEMWPEAGRIVLDRYTELARDLGVPVFPFAWYEDGSSDVVLDATGRVFLLHPADDFLVASTVDDAIIGLIGGPDLRPVDRAGNVIPPQRTGRHAAAPAPEPPAVVPVPPAESARDDRPEVFRADWTQTWQGTLRPFAVSTVVIGLLSWVIGYVLGGPVLSLLLPVLLVGGLVGLGRWASWSLSVRLSGSGIEFTKRNGGVLRMRWADVDRVAPLTGRTSNLLLTDTLAGAIGESAAHAARTVNTGPGLVGRGEELTPAEALQRGRGDSTWSPAAGAPTAVALRLNLIDHDWIHARIGELVRHYRPDLLPPGGTAGA